jgi:hypothetical protein
MSRQDFGQIFFAQKSLSYVSWGALQSHGSWIVDLFYFREHTLHENARIFSLGSGMLKSTLGTLIAVKKGVIERGSRGVKL